MFAQVACTQCQKPFQVPEPHLGQSVPCPWCKANTLAIPVTGLVIESLPDDPALAAAPNPAPTKRSLGKYVLLAVISLLVLVLTYGGARFFRGEVPAFVWSRFEAPDGTCRVDLPGGVSESELTPNPDAPVTRSGKKFSTHSWMTRIRGFVGWYDLDPTRLPLTRAEDLFAAEINRRKTENGWTVEAESTSAKVGSSEAVEVRYSDGSRKFVERYIFVTKGPKPRLYLVGIGGGGFNPEGESVRTVLGSFWFDETK